MTQVTTIDNSRSSIHKSSSKLAEEATLRARSLSAVDCTKCLCHSSAERHSQSAIAIDEHARDRLEFAHPRKNHFNRGLESRCYANSAIIPSIFHSLVALRATLLPVLLAQALVYPLYRVII